MQRKVVATLCAAFISLIPMTPQAGDEIYKVVRVIDGNALVVRRGGAQDEIRLLGVGSAESGSRFTWYLVHGRKVLLQAEPSAQDRDETGRLLRYVYLQDGTFVNAEIIKRGFGRRDLSYDFSHSEEFQAYEQHARAEGLGLFWTSMKTQILSPGQDVTREGPYHGGLDGVSNPVLIASSRVQPNYPEIARKTNVKGRAVLQLVVEKGGKVGDIWVLMSPDRDLGFDEAAIAAVRQGRFVPARKDGTPVDVRWNVVVDFVLE